MLLGLITPQTPMARHKTIATMKTVLKDAPLKFDIFPPCFSRKARNPPFTGVHRMSIFFTNQG